MKPLYAAFRTATFVRGPMYRHALNLLLCSCARHKCPVRNLMVAAPQKGEKVVPKDDMLRFMTECMTSVGVSQSHARQLAEVAVEADVRGHYSHGLNRLEMYVKDVEKKVCKAEGEPKILKERAASAWVDGDNLLGPVVGNFCMDLAIKKAKDAGVGWVVAKGSNHYGIAGWYVMRAMQEGVIGITMTNTSPLTYPTRAAEPAIGTNPIAIGANGTSGDSYLLDMATTTVAVGKIEIAKRRGDNVPETWGVAKGGKPSTNPSEILSGGGLLPLGGSEITGGYKGYGLGAIVELFCGILGGAHWGPNIRRWMDATRDADLGQCFVAIDPEGFAPGFHERLQEFINALRGLPPADEDLKVLVAGDPEKEHEKMVKDVGGIPYHPNQIKNADELAARLNVKKVNVIKEF
ncbi:unnamed protein product [Cylicocyclus nassatus]|uniref:Malate dehydrogenase n=1 Tax=Cylicocyclus nassatus TaxID=53992 RepID=A0AA36MDG2_CYLNA|nr:unnamed protein product [Cylicocyclus nassatus]